MRQKMCAEKRQEEVDDNAPLFPNAEKVQSKAVVDPREFQDHLDRTDAAILLSLETSPGEPLASNGLKRMRDLYHLLSDAEKALFLQEVNGLTGPKSKKSKQSEAALEKQTETKSKTVAKRARPYPYPDAIRTRALEFIEGRRRSGKHTVYEASCFVAPLLKAWTSWPGGHPPPNTNQVHRWIRDAKSKQCYYKDL